MRGFRAVIFDVDGTLTPVRSVWQHIHEALGLWDGAARYHQAAFEAGRIDYEEFCRRDASHWQGLDEAVLRAITDGIPYRQGVRECMAALKGTGCILGAVSTGLTLLADRVGVEFDLAFVMANRLSTQDGVLTGDVTVSVEHNHKEKAIDRFCRQFDVEPGEVITVGDSDGDISMFRRSGFSVAVHPASEATARAANLVFEGDSLLGLPGLLDLPGRTGTMTKPGSHKTD